MGREEFEALVVDGLDAIPDELAALMVNVVVLVEDEPGPDLPPDLLGLYEGTPLTERGSGWDAGALPDRITVFRGPTLRACSQEGDGAGAVDPAVVADEVATTVVHEVAHHFGIDDERLHALGWG